MSESTNEAPCTATLPPNRHCSRTSGHYDEAATPTFGKYGGVTDPGGWHSTAGPAPGVWVDSADGATPHGAGVVRPDEEPT